MIKRFNPQDMRACVELLIQVFNPPPWNDKWTPETGRKYLTEFAEAKRFVGFTVWEGEKLIGAAFCHAKVWWDNDEISVDELYISPKYQGRGYGKELLAAIVQYAKENNMVGMILLTNRQTPAPEFYRKHGFIESSDVMFMVRNLAGTKNDE